MPVKRDSGTRSGGSAEDARMMCERTMLLAPFNESKACPALAVEAGLSHDHALRLQVDDTLERLLSLTHALSVERGIPRYGDAGNIVARLEQTRDVVQLRRSYRRAQMSSWVSGLFGSITRGCASASL
jgi:hypothetical protein